MKILVTGGAGFIGSHITDELIRANHRVIVVDNLSTGNEENLNVKVKFYKMDIRDSALEDVFRKDKPELVIHHAAQINLRYSVDNPVADADTNILGTIRLFSLAVEYKVKQMIFASSGGAIYGDTKILPTPESEPAYPVCPYGIAKLTGEHYLRYFGGLAKMKWVALRYANVYGPRQNSKGEAGVVAIFADQLLSGKTPVINGDGTQTRDFVYVGDVVKANILAMTQKQSGVFNIGTSQATDINDIYKLIEKYCEVKLKVKHGPAILGEQLRSVLAYKLAGKILGWSPEMEIEEGIKKTVKWFKNNRG